MGWPHPDYLTAFLTGEQLSGWIDYSTREPFGFPIDDMRAALQAATTANAAGPDTPYSHTDFMLGPVLLDPPNEDGTPSEEHLTMKLQQLMPPKPPPQGA